jgi:hypothetical protein
MSVEDMMRVAIVSVCFWHPFCCSRVYTRPDSPLSVIAGEQVPVASDDTSLQAWKAENHHAALE